MAENTCPICGERLKNGICPECMGMQDAYESREGFNEAEYNRIYNETYNKTEENSPEDVRVIDGEQKPFSYTSERTEIFGNGTLHSFTTVSSGTSTDRVRFDRDNGPVSSHTESFFTNAENGEIPAEVLEKFAEFDREFNTDTMKRVMGIRRGEKTPLKELIFSKKHLWKFILAVFAPYLTFILGGLFTINPDSDARRVNITLILFSIAMLFVLSMVIETVGAR